jgi:hypothetical protein
VRFVFLLRFAGPVRHRHWPVTELVDEDCSSKNTTRKGSLGGKLGGDSLALGPSRHLSLATDPTLKLDHADHTAHAKPKPRPSHSLSRPMRPRAGMAYASRELISRPTAYVPSLLNSWPDRNPGPRASRLGSNLKVSSQRRVGAGRQAVMMALARHAVLSARGRWRARCRCRVSVGSGCLRACM